MAADTLSLLKALDWMKSFGVKVVNMSFSGPRDQLVAEAIEKLSMRGIIFVAAAGNDRPQPRRAMRPPTSGHRSDGSHEGPAQLPLRQPRGSHRRRGSGRRHLDRDAPADAQATILERHSPRLTSRRSWRWNPGAGLSRTRPACSMACPRSISGRRGAIRSTAGACSWLLPGMYAALGDHRQQRVARACPQGSNTPALYRGCRRGGLSQRAPSLI